MVLPEALHYLSNCVKTSRQQGMMAHTCNPALLWRLRQEECTLKASLGKTQPHNNTF